MAWYKDTLVFLPQYPHRFGDADQGALFALEKSTLLRYIQNQSPSELSTEQIVFDDGGLHKTIKGFEGFEAIAFNDDQVFLTIEASPHNKMEGFIVSGSISPDHAWLRLDPETLVQIPLTQRIKNLSDEALLIFHNRVFTIYEANGKKVNSSPVAHQFNIDLDLQAQLSFPNIEYRITDASPPDSEGFFWAINSYFPLDKKKLKPQTDCLAELYGQGETHSENLSVERLVLLQIQGNEIRLVDQPPVQLVLEGDIAPRNWEAIALLDDIGFLLATDKLPRTILGFVPFVFSQVKGK